VPPRQAEVEDLEPAVGVTMRFDGFDVAVHDPARGASPSASAI